MQVNSVSEREGISAQECSQHQATGSRDRATLLRLAGTQKCPRGTRSERQRGVHPFEACRAVFQSPFYSCRNDRGVPAPRPGEDVGGCMMTGKTVLWAFTRRIGSGTGKPRSIQGRCFLLRLEGSALSRGISCLSGEQVSGEVRSVASQGGPRERKHPSPCCQVFRPQHSEDARGPEEARTCPRGGPVTNSSLKTLNCQATPSQPGTVSLEKYEWLKPGRPPSVSAPCWPLTQLPLPGLTIIQIKPQSSEG